MRKLVSLVQYDFLQRTRSYAFLVTLCATLAIAYTFVPEPSASYSTIKIGEYVGFYNSAWFGYVTAIMTSIFLSLIGFYLVNSGVKKDADTKVGQIIASTPVSNVKYLLVKALSNFVLLLAIVAVVFLMSIVLFYLYNDGFSLQLLQFLKPYLLITIPSMVFVACLAVVLEIVLPKWPVIQNVLFFVLFSMLMVFAPKNELQYNMDVFGSKLVINQMEEAVRTITNTPKTDGLTIGYVLKNDSESKKFAFEGIDFPTSFALSRLALIFGSFLMVCLSSLLFHRFGKQAKPAVKSKQSKQFEEEEVKDISIGGLHAAGENFSILPLLKTELLVLFRTGKRWLWLINLVGMVLLATLPLSMAHTMVVPVLWFLQVSRLSGLATKERQHQMHYFALSSYHPIQRLLTSQLLAAFLLLLGLSTPLLVRYAVLFNLGAIGSILLGSLFIVFLAAVLGSLSKGRKLFEVLFFMLTYANINGIEPVDYFGAFSHHSLFYGIVAILTFGFATVVIFMKKQEMAE